MKKIFTLACSFALAASSFAQVDWSVTEDVLYGCKGYYPTEVKVHNEETGLDELTGYQITETNLFTDKIDNNFGNMQACKGDINGQWLYIDLGENSEVVLDYIGIIWEGSNAEQYDIIGTNTVPTLTDASNNSYLTVTDGVIIGQEANATPGSYINTKITSDNHYRYIVIKPTKFSGNATTYGMRPFEVRGNVKVAEAALTNLVVTLNKNEIIQTQSVTYNVVGTEKATEPYGYTKNVTEDVVVTYVPANEGLTIDNGTITATKSGNYDITFTYEGLEKHMLLNVLNDVALGVVPTTTIEQVAPFRNPGNIALLTDGSTSTLWGPDDNYFNVEGQQVFQPFSISFDLGSNKTLTGMKVFYDGGACANTYSLKVKAEGDAEWTVIKDNAAGGEGQFSVSLDDVVAREVEYTIESARNVNWGVKLSEIYLLAAGESEEIPASIIIDTNTKHHGFVKVTGELTAETAATLEGCAETALDLRELEMPAGTTITTANPNVLLGVSNAQIANLTNTTNVVSFDEVVNYNVAKTPLVFDESEGKIWSCDGQWIDARQGADYSRTIAAGTYATVASIAAINELPEGLKVYEFSEMDGEDVVFVEATKISKDVPYIVYADGKDVTITAHANNGDVIKKDNEQSVEKGNVIFKSNYVAFRGTAEGNLYGLAAGETNKTLKHIGASANVGPFRAYFIVEGTAPSNVRFVDSTLTTIATVATSEIEGLTFNLAGQRVNNANGIVVKNGKKVIR